MKIKKEYLIGFVIFFLIVIFYLLYSIKHILLDKEIVRDFIASTGAYAPLVLIGLQLFQTIVPFVPGGIITMSGGYLFGVFKGTLYSLIGIFLGSLIVFQIARTFGRPLFDKKKDTAFYKDINAASKKYGFIFLLLTRMMPFFPHNILSYALGTTDIPRVKFVLATIIGFSVHSFFHNYIGNSVYNEAFNWGFYLILMFFVIGMAVFVFRKQILRWLVSSSNSDFLQTKKYLK
jgi:uncharacterized membrane protein YdjX (TVP38/TMEM64 family)